MSIDFATLQGVTIPEGVVTQITDAAGNVLWVLANDEPVVLQVEKITADTYAGETTYTGEQFILLDIYPKTPSSTVKVTYGNLTKTLSFSGTNAKQVYFGTFNGVSDSVETPDNGELTIEGGCSGFACGAYQKNVSGTNKGQNAHCNCITDVIEWGGVTKIPDYGFYSCGNIELSELSSRITSIGTYAFNGCTALALTELPSGITSIVDYAFYDCFALALTELPSGITSIGDYAFFLSSDSGVAFSSITIPESVTSIGHNAMAVLRKIDSDGYECTLARANTVYMSATTPPSINSSFGNRNADYYIGDAKFRIYVPAGCGEVYKAAEGWSQYAIYITEAS